MRDRALAKMRVRKLALGKLGRSENADYIRGYADSTLRGTASTLGFSAFGVLLR